MSDLFPPAIVPEAIYSPAFRVMPVLGDNMAPTLRANFDYVLVAPIGRYIGEGIYAVELGGAINLKRCESNFRGGVRLTNDCKAYSSDWEVTRDEFEESVVGKVVALVKVQDPDLLANPANRRQNMAWRVQL